MLTAFLSILLLISLGTYPLEEIRLLGLPLPLVLATVAAVFHCLSCLKQGLHKPILKQDAILTIVAISLLLILLVVSSWGAAVTYYDFSFDHIKGILYIACLPILGFFLRPFSNRWIWTFLLIGMLIPILVGYYRFITLEGGELGEHLIGYWGIRYVASTRNADVLYPLIGAVASGALLVGQKGVAARLGLFLSFCLSAFAVIQSLSRGAWVALIIALLIMFGKTLTDKRHSAKIILGTAITTGFFVSVALFTSVSSSESNASLIVERALTMTSDSDPTNSSNADRMEILQDTVNGMVTHPFGVGVGNIAFSLNRANGSIGNAENAYLTLAAEGGWISMGLLLGLTYIILKQAYIHGRSSPATPSAFQKAPLALASAFAVYLIFNHELNSLLIWSIFGVVWATSTSRSNRNATDNFRPDTSL